MKCELCPHRCGADRVKKPGICRAPAQPKIARAALHYYEEPAISGANGSGTIFFSHCNLACVFCQNYDISQFDFGHETTISGLAQAALDLKAKGAHNINLVSPTPYTNLILDALLPVKKRLGIPIVWNSNGYELVPVLERLEPLVDIYLPDLKFFDPVLSGRYCRAGDYFVYASEAIGEMWRQKSEVKLGNIGDSSVMAQGLIVRHLVIPGCIEDSKKILRWIADNLGLNVHVSLMAQYIPVHRAPEFPEVNRRLTYAEYDEVCRLFYELGFENGWVQELDSADLRYTPKFDLTGVVEITPKDAMKK